MSRHLRESGRGWLSRPWLWALGGSLALHAALALAVIAWQAPAPTAPSRVVIPVEPIRLTQAPPAPSGGGGQPVPEVKPPAPVARPRPGPSARPRPATPKPPQQEDRPKPSLPPEALALARPELPAAGATSGPASGGGPPGAGGPQGSGGSGGGYGSGRGRGSGPGGGPGAGSGNVLQGYLGEVRRLLEQQKDYPIMARRAHMQGVAVLRFTIEASGAVGGTHLRQSSGHAVLDQAARQTVQRVGRFPPLPPALGKERLTIEIPLAFRLRER